MKKNKINDFRFVDRREFILNLCSGKNVLHLGATASPKTEKNIKDGKLLHVSISEISKLTIGMDFDQIMIDVAKRYGINNIVYGNVERYEDYPKITFDIIVAGEIFEHLNNPGLAVEALAKIAKSTSDVIVTVPNAYSIKSILRASLGYELIHPDHILFHSPATLIELFRRYDFYPYQKIAYVNGGSGILFYISQLLFNLKPYLADGIGIVFKKNENITK